jgi:S1-C subfamily serine protease
MAQGGNPDSSEIEADRFDEAQSLLSEIKEIENVLSDIKGEDLVGTRVDGEKRLRALLAETVGRQLDGGGSEGAELAENYSSEEISQARKVAASVRESVVVIAATWEESGSQYEGDATAWMVSPRVAITNDHNVRNQAGNPIDPSGVAIFDIQGNKYGVESFLILDREFDVAAILLDSDFPGPLIDLTLSSPAEVGDIVVVVGHPSQIGYWVQSIARVKLYQPGRDVFSGDGGVGGGSLQISLGISDGSSGSPVFNLSGNFVGILHSSPAITSDDLSGAPFNGGPLSVLPSQDESFGSSADDVIRIVGELTL